MNLKLLLLSIIILSVPAFAVTTTFNVTTAVITDFGGIANYTKNTSAINNGTSIVLGIADETGDTNSTGLTNPSFVTNLNSWTQQNGGCTTLAQIGNQGAAEANQTTKGATSDCNLTQTFVVQSPIRSGILSFMISKQRTGTAPTVHNMSVMIRNSTNAVLMTFSNQSTTITAGPKTPYTTTIISNLSTYFTNADTYTLELYYKFTTGGGAGGTASGDFDEINLSFVYKNLSRAYFKFNISSIPTNNTIQSAYLYFNVTNSTTAGYTSCLDDVADLNASLTNSNSGANFWSAAGNDNYTGSQPINRTSCAANGIITANVTSFIQTIFGNTSNKYFNGTLVAFGLNESTMKNNYTIEAPFTQFGVRLNITYTAPAAAADSCTPTANANWTITASDKCNIVGKNYNVDQIRITGAAGYVLFSNSNITAKSCIIEPSVGALISIFMVAPLLWINGCFMVW